MKEWLDKFSRNIKNKCGLSMDFWSLIKNVKGIWNILINE